MRAKPPVSPVAPDAGKRPPGEQPWHVYLIRCADGSLYGGITVDVVRRLAEHRAGKSRAAKYLRGRGPLELAYSAPAGSRAEASQAEYRLKRLPKSEKEAMVRTFQSRPADLPEG